MEPLANILSNIIAGKSATPHHLMRGARLDYDPQTQQLTITRLNRAPDGAEMGVFINYIKRAGYHVTGRTLVEINPSANSWVGYRLQLVKIEQPPAVEQGSLF